MNTKNNINQSNPFQAPHLYRHFLTENSLLKSEQKKYQGKSLICIFLLVIVV